MNKTWPSLPCILAKIQFLGPWWFAVGVLWIMYEYFIKIISAARWYVSALLWFSSVLYFGAVIVSVPSPFFPSLHFLTKKIHFSSPVSIFPPLTLVLPALSLFPIRSSFHILSPALVLTKATFTLAKKTKVIDGSHKESPTQHQTMTFMAVSQLRGCRLLQTAFDVTARRKVSIQENFLEMLQMRPSISWIGAEPLRSFAAFFHSFIQSSNWSDILSIFSVEFLLSWTVSTICVE